MRPIKFRGKRVDNSEWVYGYLYQDETGTYIKVSDRNGRFGCGAPVIPETVGQFTGLKDKTGKDIYEGDWIQHNENVFIIKWVAKKGNAVYGLCLLEKSRPQNWRGLEWLFNVQKYVSVIGNIHEQ